MNNIRLLRGITITLLLLFLATTILAYHYLDLSTLNLTGYSILESQKNLPLQENIIFYEGFFTPTLEGWTTSTNNQAGPWKAETKEAYLGHYSAASTPQTEEGNSILQRTISTKGHNHLKIRYTRKIVGLDTEDHFWVQWNDGRIWKTLETVNSQTDKEYQERSFNLPREADNNEEFTIRFICQAGAPTETCLVDEVILTEQP